MRYTPRILAASMLGLLGAISYAEAQESLCSADPSKLSLDLQFAQQQMCTTASQPMIGSVTLAAVPLVAGPGNNVIVVNAPAVKKKPGKKPASTRSSTASDVSSQTSESSEVSSQTSEGSGSALKAAKIAAGRAVFDAKFPQGAVATRRTTDDLNDGRAARGAELGVGTPRLTREAEDVDQVLRGTYQKAEQTRRNADRFDIDFRQTGVNEARTNDDLDDGGRAARGAQLGVTSPRFSREAEEADFGATQRRAELLPEGSSLSSPRGSVNSAAQYEENLNRFNTDFPQHGQLDTRSEPDLAMTSQSEKADLYWSKPNDGRYSQDDEHVTEFDADRAHNTVQSARAEQQYLKSFRAPPPGVNMLRKQGLMAHVDPLDSPRDSEFADAPSDSGIPDDASSSSSTSPRNSAASSLVSTPRDGGPDTTTTTTSATTTTAAPLPLAGPGSRAETSSPAARPPKGVAFNVGFSDPADQPPASFAAEAASVIPQGHFSQTMRGGPRGGALSEGDSAASDVSGRRTMTTQEMLATRRAAFGAAMDDSALGKARKEGIRRNTRVALPAYEDDDRFPVTSPARSRPLPLPSPRSSDDDFDRDSHIGRDDDMPPMTSLRVPVMPQRVRSAEQEERMREMELQRQMATQPPYASEAERLLQHEGGLEGGSTSSRPISTLLVSSEAERALAEDARALTLQNATTGRLELSAATGASSSSIAARRLSFGGDDAASSSLPATTQTPGQYVGGLQAALKRGPLYVEGNPYKDAVDKPASAVTYGQRILNAVKERSAQVADSQLIGAYNALKVHWMAQDLDLINELPADTETAVLSPLAAELERREIRPCTGGADEPGCANLTEGFYPTHVAI